MARNKSRQKRNEFRFSITWNARLAPHQVTAKAFHDAVASGWIVATGEKTAVVASNVKAALHNGVLWLEDTARKAMAWIYTSWIAISRISPVIEGDYWRKEIELQYGDVRSKKVEADGTWIDRCDWKVSLA